jgi:hypothetical protein
MNTYLLTSLTLAEFKQFKVALRQLIVLGIDHDTAVDIILTGVSRKRKQRDEHNETRRQFRSA